MCRASRHRGWTALTAALLVPMAGCAVSQPLEITSTGSGMARGASVTITAEDDAASERGRFAKALQDALAARSSTQADDAPLIADFSIARTAAAGGVINGKGEAGQGKQAPDWIAAPRPDRRFDKCNAQRLRATLVLYDRANGAIVYRGSGMATECGFTDADIAALAHGLVDDAVARATN